MGFTADRLANICIRMSHEERTAYTLVASGLTNITEYQILSTRQLEQSFKVACNMWFEVYGFVSISLNKVYYSTFHISV